MKEKNEKETEMGKDCFTIPMDSATKENSGIIWDMDSESLDSIKLKFIEDNGQLMNYRDKEKYEISQL